MVITRTYEKEILSLETLLSDANIGQLLADDDALYLTLYSPTQGLNIYHRLRHGDWDASIF